MEIFLVSFRPNNIYSFVETVPLIYLLSNFFLQNQAR